MKKTFGDYLSVVGVILVFAMVFTLMGTFVFSAHKARVAEEKAYQSGRIHYCQTSEGRYDRRCEGWFTLHEDAGR